MGIIGAIAEGLPPQFGTATDGDIIIKTGATVYIRDIYENNVVAGVITKNGDGYGLNYGSGTYNPKIGRYFNCVNFTIQPGATLTATPWQRESSGCGVPAGVTKDDRNGIIWIACFSGFVNQGIVDVNFLGGGGGRGECSSSGHTGQGYGGGTGNARWGGVPGGIAYGTTNISYTTWDYLYGSGGGGARKVQYDGGRGGLGGGAIRIYAVSTLDTSSGYIYARGENRADSGGALDGSTTGSSSSGCSGGGGGGAGGTIYMESLGKLYLGTSQILATGGQGGYGGGPGSQYPNHGGGGGGGGNATAGGAGGGQYSARYAGNGGTGANGRIAVRGSVFSGTTSPSYVSV